VRRACAERGLAGVAITDHDSFEGSLIFARELHGLIVIPGEEIRSSEGEIIGLFISEQIEPGLAPEATMDLIHEQGGIVVVPHPFDLVKLKRMKASRLRELRDRIDAVEGTNGKPRYWRANRLALAFAEEMGLPMTAGSDAHVADHVGLVYCEMEDFSSRDEFLEGLKNASLGGSRYSPWASQLDRWKARLR
jgi:predicted metal-dependent phosphoesterase TrpH